MVVRQVKAEVRALQAPVLFWASLLTSRLLPPALASAAIRRFFRGALRVP